MLDAKLADMLNLSPRRVQQLAAEGIIPNGDTRGRYNVGGAVRGYGSVLQKQAARADKDPTFREGKTANEALNAQERRLRLNLKRMKGELIDHRQATALVAQLAREGRASWARWPSCRRADGGRNWHRGGRDAERHVRAHLEKLAEVVKPEFR